MTHGGTTRWTAPAATLRRIGEMAGAPPMTDPKEAPAKAYRAKVKT